MTAQFFGFFGNAFDSWGACTEATRAYTNLHWVEAGYTDKLWKARGMGAKAIVSASAFMFNEPSTTASPHRAALAEWWGTLLADERDVVVAFNVVDEPYRRNDNHVHLPADEVTRNLNEAAVWLGGLTGKKMCITASGNEYDKWGVPASFDWIGMYRYSYNTHWAMLWFSALNLKRQLRPGQKIMAIMDAYGDVEHPPDEPRIRKFNDQWQTFLNWYGKDVVAICPFLYQSPIMNGKQVWGASSMPRVLLDLQSVGIKVMRSRGVA